MYYFIEETAVDPLASETLGENAFEVYELKRLIRAKKYAWKRDTSFDFL